MHSFIVAALGIMFGFSVTNTNTLQKSEDYEAVSAEAMRSHVEHLSGVYTNKEALDMALASMSPDEARKPIYREMAMVVFPIWKKHHTSHDAHEWWFYFGWYSTNSKEIALDEAILHCSIKDGLAHTEMYSLPAGHTYAMQWKSKHPFADLHLADLKKQPHTALYSQELNGGGIRFFSPLEQPFERTGSSVSAYHYINFDVRFYPDQITSKSSFLDNKHNPINLKSLDYAFNKSAIDITDF